MRKLRFIVIIFSLIQSKNFHHIKIHHKPQKDEKPLAILTFPKKFQVEIHRKKIWL